MRNRILVLSFVSAALLAAGVGSTPALAQQYPPPTPTATPDTEVESCVAVEGEVGDEFVVGQAEYQGEIHVSGSQGAAGGQSNVTIYAEPGHVLIGSVPALEDGSYSGTLTLPAGLQPGTYELATDVASCTETATLQVLSASGTGTDVLGGSETNVDDGTAVLGASGAKDGNLPVTGSDILDLVLLALVLLVVGEGLRRVTKNRRSQRTAGWGFLKARPLALPEPMVPHLDTRGFVASERARQAVASTASVATSAPVSVRSTWDRDASSSAPETSTSASSESTATEAKPPVKETATRRTKSASPKSTTSTRSSNGASTKTKTTARKSK